MWCHPRGLRNDCRVQITQYPVRLLNQLHYPAQQEATIDTRVSRIGIGKMLTNIALAERSQ